jgi:peptidyl-prolyl cis-trans isomerase SurA
LKTDRSVATFADQELRQSTILEFWAKNQKQQSEDAIEEYLRLLFNVVSNDKIIAYEDSQLEVKYPDFRNLVREYREGILLFDLTQEEVWDKAAKDSVGIYDHYQKIKSNYTWDDRISYKLWVAQNERDAKRIVKWVSKQKDSKLKSFLTSNDALAVAVSSGTAQKKDDEVLQLMWNTTPGVYGPVDYNDGFAVIQVIDYLPSAPKALNEVKGLVIASYQNELESAWVKSLEEKFDVSIDQAVKEKLFLELAD